MSAQDQIDRVRGKHGDRGATTTLHDLLKKQKAQIALALPKHMDPERMVRIAWTAIRSSPRLLECEQLSILGGVMEAAQLGLELDGVLGHAYLVPYRNKGRPQAQFQIGYRGMILLATRGGAQSVSAEVVRGGDDFDFEQGTNAFLRHKRKLGDRGDALAVWASVKLASGGTDFRVLDLDDIERARKSSKGRDGDDSPWTKFWDEMARKTAVRSLLKYQPLAPEVVRAVVRDEYRERGLEVADDDVLGLPETTIDAEGEPSPAGGAS